MTILINIVLLAQGQEKEKPKHKTKLMEQPNYLKIEIYTFDLELTLQVTEKNCTFTKCFQDN